MFDTPASPEHGQRSEVSAERPLCHGRPRRPAAVQRSFGVPGGTQANFAGMPRTADHTRLGGTAASRRSTAAPRRELGGRHPRLAELLRLAHPVERAIPDDRPLSHLVVRTIVGQLVSTAAARSIMNTLLDAHGDVDGVIAWAMRTPDDALPAHSLSRAKRKAIAHWGRYLADHGDPRARWAALPADELVAAIVELRGLGRWSAHMIAIFGFGHPEIWPDGDAGVMRVARVVFKGMRQPTLRKLIRGHETHVALCCWSVLDKGRLPELLTPPASRRPAATSPDTPSTQRRRAR
jgi:DNA-3-methyladenine glycosylase II